MGTTTLLYRFIGLDAGAGAEFDKMAGKTAMLGKTSSTALTALKGLGIGAAAGMATPPRRDFMAARVGLGAGTASPSAMYS